VNIYQFPEASEVIAILELGLNQAIAGEITSTAALNGMADGIPGSGRMHGDDAEPEKPHAQRSPTTLLLCPMTMTPFHQTIALATHETISHRCMTESEKLRCGKELMRSSL